MKKHIPNCLTLLNLLSGSIALMFALQNQLQMVLYCTIFSLIMDVLDGLMARVLRVQSAIGKDLDSLADVVSFGLVPAFVLFSIIGQSDVNRIDWNNSLIGDLIKYSVLVVVLAAAYRLAKFNNDPRQTNYFHGLPTPAFALAVVFSGFIFEQFPTGGLHLFLLNPYYILGLAFLGSYLMVSDHAMFALKFDSFTWKTNSLQITFLISCILLLLFFHWVGVVYSVVLYVLLSLLIFKPTRNEIRS